MKRAQQMKSSYLERDARVAWYWWLSAFVNLALGAALLVDGLNGDHETPESKAVSFVAAFVLLFFGSALGLVCRRYQLFVDGSHLVYQVLPFIDRKHDIRGVRDVRLSGLYLSLDYGAGPKPVILLLCRDRMRLFYRVAERAHNLPPDTLSRRSQA